MDPTLLLLALAQAAAQPVSAPPRAVAVGVARARIISAARISVSSAPTGATGDVRVQRRGDARVELVFE